jgi:hypothetical protein
MRAYLEVSGGSMQNMTKIRIFQNSLNLRRKKLGRGENVPRRGGQEERTFRGVNTYFGVKIVLI